MWFYTQNPYVRYVLWEWQNTEENKEEVWQDSEEAIKEEVWHDTEAIKEDV